MCRDLVKKSVNYRNVSSRKNSFELWDMVRRLLNYGRTLSEVAHLASVKSCAVAAF
jgi:hypothetical protein